jgi:hypothetical protein
VAEVRYQTADAAREAAMASRTNTAYYSMGNMANSNAAAIAAKVRGPNSLYTQALATADSVAFSNIFAQELDRLRAQKRSDGFGNNANYLQALLRSAGGSKGTTPLGSFDLSDSKALRDAMVAARLNGVEYFTFLEDMSKNGIGTGGPKTRFSKDASTAINLIDKSDATTTFTKGYYTAFGKMPTDSQITAFMNKFNAKAKQEAVTTTVSGKTTTSKAGSTGKSTTTRSGLGFTEQEQSNYLAKYLGYYTQITPEVSGASKVVLDEIRNTYKNNGLQEPAFESMAKIVKDVISTGDSEMAKQKITEAKQKIRNLAAKLNPGAADLLASGEDMSTISEQYIKLAESVTKKKYTIDSPIIKQMVNMKDEKGAIRSATNWEAYGIIRNSTDWDKSSDAYSTYSNIGDVLTSKLGL